MGLISQRASERLARLRYIYGWRLRYWWMDTESGARAHVAGFVLSVLVLIVQIVRMSIQTLFPQPLGGQQQAVYWWVVQLVIAVVGAVLSYALRPKTQAPPEPEHKSPVVDDGQSVDDYFGENWIDSPALLAWKMTGRSPIKAKGGK